MTAWDVGLVILLGAAALTFLCEWLKDDYNDPVRFGLFVVLATSTVLCATC